MPKRVARTGYTIAAVSKLTGISCHALRAWERRYGLPMPVRTTSGHRRYDAEQIRLVRIVVDQVAKGQALAEVMAEVRSGRATRRMPEPPASEAVCGSAIDLLDRLLAGNLDEAENYYRALTAECPPADLATTVLGPAMTEIGERWFRGECSVCQEHHATAFLRRKLHTLTDAALEANRQGSHLALVGTVQGDRHEGGVLIVCLLLELCGWHAIDLGVDLPVRQFQEAVVRWRPDALGVSFVLSRNVNKRFGELSQIREVPVFVGGRSILNYQGLARRHGLIPLPGPATTAIRTMVELFAAGTASENFAAQESAHSRASKNPGEARRRGSPG